MLKSPKKPFPEYACPSANEGGESTAVPFVSCFELLTIPSNDPG